MKIIYEKEGCIGCGSCASVCPKHFEIGDDGKSNLKNSKINPDTKNYEVEIDKEDCSKDASSVCPVEIIHIEK